MRLLCALCLLVLLAASASADVGCEVLIKKQINTTCDNDSTCWQRGDPLAVQEIGFAWGSSEVPEAGRFVIVTVTDVTVLQARNWLEVQYSDSLEVRRLRMRRMIWANLPQAVKDSLRITGRYTTTWTAIKQFIRNMRTGVMGE